MSSAPIYCVVVIPIPISNNMLRSVFGNLSIILNCIIDISIKGYVFIEIFRLLFNVT